MEKFDARLKALVADRRQGRRAIQAEGAPDQPVSLPDQEERITVFLKFRDDLEPIKDLGFASRTVVGNLATGHLALSDLDTIASHPNVLKIQLSRGMTLELDTSISETRADEVRHLKADRSGWEGTATGAGVIVGVIDSGINFKHQSFRNTDGTTRILAIWDQRDNSGLTPDEYGDPDDPADPNPYEDLDYGTVFDQEAINDALAEDSPMPIAHQDRSGHGTHVAGIAAGNGRQDDFCVDAFTYAGVAPEADLIIVKFRRDEDLFGEEDSDDDILGEDTHLIDAIKFINSWAEVEGKPVVINISMGDNLGPHDGASFVEQMIDGIYDALSTGKALVKSAGNEGNKRRHTDGEVPASDQIDIPFKVRNEDDRIRVLNVWYPGAHSLDCVVVPPEGDATDPPAPPETLIVRRFDVEGGGEVVIISEENDLDNGDKNILVKLIPPEDGHLQPDTWNLRLINGEASEVPFHCWIERHLSSSDKPPTFENPTDQITLSIPGTAKNAIVVANYINTGDNAGKRNGSSSLGPTRDTRPADEQKPDLAAPGTAIRSARAKPLGCCETFWCECCSNQFHIDKTGTSMAAPHVTGAVALMLEIKPDIDTSEILSTLRETARTDGFTSTVDPDEPAEAPPNRAWGAGKLNVEDAVEAVAASLLEPPTPVPAILMPLVRPPSLPGPAVLASTPLPRPGPPIMLDLEALRERFLSTRLGRDYAALVEKHFDEVLRLINTNKRVATVWHRNGGPMIVRAVLRSLALPDEPLPEVINDVSLRDRLDPFLAILRRYASDDLHQDIDQHEELLWQFQGKSVNQLLNLIEQPVT